MVLTLIGAVLPLFLADPKKMYREDGTKVTVPRNPSWKVEIMALFYALWNDPLIVLLWVKMFSLRSYTNCVFDTISMIKSSLPMFWASVSTFFMASLRYSFDVSVELVLYVTTH